MKSYEKKLLDNISKMAQENPDNTYEYISKAYKIGKIMSSVENIFTIEEIQQELLYEEGDIYDDTAGMLMCKEDVNEFSIWLSTTEGLNSYLKYYDNSLDDIDEAMSEDLHEYRFNLIDHLTASFLSTHPPF